MSRTNRWSLGRLALIVVLLMSVGISVNAADRSLTKDVQETEVSVMAAPVSEALDWQADMPVLTKEQEESLAAWAEKTHLPGPLIEGKEEGLDAAARAALPELAAAQHADPWFRLEARWRAAGLTPALLKAYNTCCPRPPGRAPAANGRRGG